MHAPFDLRCRAKTRNCGRMNIEADPATPKRPIAFISHHSSQYDAAKAVKAALADAGIDGWLAPDDIEPGATFDTAIVEQVKRSDFVVLLLCAQSDRSRHVKRELMIADDAGKPIFPVRTQAIEADGLAYWLKDYQWIDWIDRKGDGIDRLIAAIGRRAGYEPRSAPAVPVRPASRKRAIWIGGGAIALLAVAGGTAVMLRPGVVAAETQIEPGRWIARREVLAITYPELPPEMKQQIKQTLENDPDPEECISPAVARAPDVQLFDPGGKGKCTLVSFKMAAGRMSGYLACPLPGTNDGSVMQVTFRGTYSRTSIEIQNDITISQPGGMLKLRARDSSQWQAKDCSVG
jgi:hypothetical protein